MNRAYKPAKAFDGETYTECGCCGEWHPTHFAGDCRDDGNRYTTDELEDHYGQDRFWDRLAIEIA